MSARIINIEDENAWHRFRGTGIGASEVPALIGLSPHKSKLELFYDKVGFRPKSFINLLMLSGKITEQLTSDIFECYNGGTVNETAANVQNGKRFRTCKKLPHLSFIQNDDWPHLFVSPDREFSTSSMPSGSLEIKDTSSQYLANFKDKFAPTHIVQLKTQMAVWEKDWGCLSYLIDRGRDYREQFYFRDRYILNDIDTGFSLTENDLKIQITEFWDSVVLAREATHKMCQAKLNFNMKAANEYQSIIDQCEPEPDHLLAYENYMKDSYYSIARPKIEVQGTDQHLKVAEDFIRAKEYLGKANNEMQLCKNTVLSICKLGQSIRLPGKGIIEVNATKVGHSIKVKL